MSDTDFTKEDFGRYKPDPRIAEATEKILATLADHYYQSSRHLCMNTMCSIEDVLEVVESHEDIAFKMVGSIAVYFLKVNEPRGALYNTGDNSFAVREILPEPPKKPTIVSLLRANLSVIENHAVGGKPVRELAELLGVNEKTLSNYLAGEMCPEARDAWKRGRRTGDHRAEHAAIAAKLTPEAIEETTAATKTLPQMAKKLDVNINTLRSALAHSAELTAAYSRGKARREPSKTKREEVAHLRGNYGKVAAVLLDRLDDIEAFAAQGMTQFQISEALGLNIQSFSNAIMRENCKEVRLAWDRGRESAGLNLTPSEIATIERVQDAGRRGLTQKEAAKEIGLSVTTFKRELQSRPDLRAAWDGARAKSSGSISKPPKPDEIEPAPADAVEVESTTESGTVADVGQMESSTGEFDQIVFALWECHRCLTRVSFGERLPHKYEGRDTCNDCFESLWKAPAYIEPAPLALVEVDDGLSRILEAIEASEVKPSAVDHPKHYNQHPSGVECIDVVEHMNFNLGNAVKYIWRADHKDAPIEDLEKAVWYVKREIDRRTRAANAST